MKKLSPMALALVKAFIEEPPKIKYKSKYGIVGWQNRAFLTPKELAVLLQITTKTLERWRKDGSGPPFIKFYGSRIRYPIVDLDSWIAIHTTCKDSSDSSGINDDDSGL